MNLPELFTNYHAAYLRGYRAARKAAGQCRDCKQPVASGVRCEAHAEAHRAQMRAEWLRGGKARRKAAKARDRARRDEARARVREVRT